MTDFEDEVIDHAEHALELLSEENTEELSDYLDQLHPVELMNVIGAVDSEIQPALLRHVRGLDQIAALISYAEHLRPLILPFLDDSRIAAITRRLEDDEAVDVIGELPRRRQVSVLRRLSPQRARELLSLLAYDQETAGGLMTTAFVSVRPDALVNEAVEKIRSGLSSGDMDPDTDVYDVYVLDDEERIQGTCSLRDLLAASGLARMDSIMQHDVVTVSPDDDQERVITLTKDYALRAIPVVAPENEKMLGIITVDDVLDVMEEESTQDILRLAGTEDTDYVGASILTALKARTPWLVASWAGGIGGALLLGSFGGVLERYVALAFFMPVVFGMGGNVGSQSSTITVRGLALGDLVETRVFSRARTEAMVGLTLGCAFGMLLAGASFVIFHDRHLSEVVGTSIFATMTCAATMGSVIPVFFKRLGYDPAVASGPLVTTLTDLLSILIYFSVATVLL